MKFIIYLFLPAFIFGCDPGISDPQADPCAASEPVAFVSGNSIQINRKGEFGIFDPSLDCDPQTGNLWMSYSAVDSTPNSEWAVQIRLAHSVDSGLSWEDDGILFDYRNVTVGPLPSLDSQLDIPENTPGVWNSETSSIIHDPDAPAGQRWKLVWHQYLRAADQSYFVDYGWIGLKYADSPVELKQANAVKWMAGFGLQSEAETTAAPAFSPIGGPAVIRFNTQLTQSAGADLSELNGCVFAEPGFGRDQKGLYLTTFCKNLADNGISIVMFQCDHPCDMRQAGRWRYLGRILPANDATAFQHDHFSAPDIILIGSEHYLMVTPVASPDRYDGCMAFRFTDIGQGLLERDQQGDLVPYLQISGISNTHNGACGYHQIYSQGIMLSQTRPDDLPELFRIVNIPGALTP